jgi:enoyl-CoA hydratase
VSVIRRLVRAGAVDGGQAAWASRAELRSVFGSEDAREGALAFAEKRTPQWVGR